MAFAPSCSYSPAAPMSLPALRIKERKQMCIMGAALVNWAKNTNIRNNNRAKDRHGNISFKGSSTNSSTSCLFDNYYTTKCTQRGAASCQLRPPTPPPLLISILPLSASCVSCRGATALCPSVHRLVVRRGGRAHAFPVAARPAALLLLIFLTA